MSSVQSPVDWWCLMNIEAFTSHCPILLYIVRIIFYYIILYYIILYYIILYYTMLFHIMLYYDLLYYKYYVMLYYVLFYYIILSYLIFYAIILYYVILYCIVSYHIILYYIVLYCIILYYIVLDYTGMIIIHYKNPQKILRLVASGCFRSYRKTRVGGLALRPWSGHILSRLGPMVSVVDGELPTQSHQNIQLNITNVYIKCMLSICYLPHQYFFNHCCSIFSCAMFVSTSPHRTRRKRTWTRSLRCWTPTRPGLDPGIDLLLEQNPDET